MRETMNLLDEPCHQRALFTIEEGLKDQRSQVSSSWSPAIPCTPSRPLFSLQAPSIAQAEGTLLSLRDSQG